MAVQQYGSGPYRATTSTASNQNTLANQWQDQYSTGQNQARPSSQQSGAAGTMPTMTQQQSNPSNSPWAPQYTPNYGQSSNPYTSAWGTSAGAPSARQPDGTGPYNPNMPQTTTPGMQPPTPSPYTPGQAPGPWTPNLPTAPVYTPYTPATTQQWGSPMDASGVAWDPADFNTQALRDQYTAYMQASMPYWQFQQNNQQWATDFNESARRTDWSAQQQALNDARTYGLNERQQHMSEWQLQEAAQQWAAQFDQTNQNNAFSQDLANRQYGLEDRRLGGDQWYQQQQVNLAGQQQAIDQAYNEGRLSLEQRSIALAELTQQQQQAYQYYQLQSSQQYGREQLSTQLGFDREELANLQSDQLRRDELARWQQQQQMQMQQADIEAQRQNAILSATGRAAGQAPNTQWMRRF